MKTFIPSSQAGRNIPCDCRISGNEKKVCIIAHGFASSKQSGTAQMMLDHLPSFGVGGIAFDFPCHGESGAEFGALTVDSCLSDMRAVELYAKTLAKDAEIVYFGSSFGAYITLCHLCSCEHEGKRAFLRCAAVDMDHAFDDVMDTIEGQLETLGYGIYDPGFGDGLKLSRGFFDSLKGRSVFDMELPAGAEIRMIHGLADDVVDPEAAKSYAAKIGCPIYLIPGTGHSIDNEEGISTLREKTAEFFGR